MPIIGNNLIGPLNVTRPRNPIGHHDAIHFYTAGPNESVTQFFLYARTTVPDGTFNFAAVYTVTGGHLDVRVAEPTGIFIPGGALAWYSSFPVNIPLSAGVTYTIASQGQALFRYFNVIDSAESANSPTLPNPWVPLFMTPWDMSFYAVVGPSPSDPLKYPCCAQRPI